MPPAGGGQGAVGQEPAGTRPRVIVGWPQPPGEADVLLALRLAGEARPKARARHGQGKTYSDAATVAFETGVAVQVQAAMQGRPPWEGPVGVRLHFVLSKRIQDIDNLVKGVLDGATLGKGRGALRSDKQVRTLVVTDEVNKVEQCTFMVIYRPGGAT